MPLGTGYAGQTCTIARALEVVGERWTLLVLRDLFFGVRRFADLQAHLDIPRAVLSSRLASLVEHGLVARRPYGAGRDEYLLTERGEELWPALHALARWGERHAAPDGPNRIYAHAGCAAELTPSGRCPDCGDEPAPADVETRPRPGAVIPRPRTDRVSAALRRPHRLLEPLLPAA
jgi:DNA-binding HxlR family transcriptional regulator